MRSTEVFFYGLFMDSDLLVARGVRPSSSEKALVNDYVVQIGERATLVRAPGRHVYGIVSAVNSLDLDQLYSEPSLREYRPEAILVRTLDGALVAAICYNLPNDAPLAARDSAYAARLMAVARKVGLPEEYVESL